MLIFANAPLKYGIFMNMWKTGYEVYKNVILPVVCLAVELGFAR
jgi:hypothetical protein